YVFHWTTTGGKLMANVGKAIHTGHQVWFSDWDVGGAMLAFTADYDKLIGAEADGLEPKDPCQRENVYAIVEQYYLTHPKEFYPFEPIVEGIEKVHSAPLVDDVQFFGLVDLPAREKKTNALCVVDHKNRFGYISEWWTKKFSLTSQFSGYIWVLQKMYNEIVPSVYINAIQVQKLPDPTTTRCKTHKVPYKECRLQHATSQMFISSRTPLAIQCWETQAIALARKFKLLKTAFTSVDMVPYAPDE
ncbi:unnamed protein product, partial [marine sediment metagenome]